MTSRLLCALATALIVVSYFAGSPSVYADNEKKTVSLEQFRAIVLEASPLVRQIESEFARKQADSLAVKRLSNPELSAEMRFPVSEGEERGDNEAEVSLSQPLRLSHFGMRGEVGRLMEAAAQSEQKSAILELSQTATLAYVKLWALQQQEKYLRAARLRADAKAKTVKDAMNKGLLGAGDEKLFFAEERKISAQLIGIDADIAAAIADASKISGSQLSDILTTKPSIEAPPSVDELFSKAQHSSIGSVERANLLVRVADKQYALAKRDSFPDLAPRIVYEHTSDKTDRIGVGISIALPFSDRNQSERHARLAELSAARASAQYANSDALHDELASLRRSFDSSLKQARVYQDDVVPAFQEALKSHEKQFEAGQVGILQVWQTQREMNDSQKEALEFWVKAYSARTQLSIVIGEEL